jgi:WXG100 family type VII secretion target
MTNYRVDSARVTQAAGAVQASASAISQEADRMMRQLLDLQGSWEGQGASSFQHVVNDWRATQERVRAALEDIQQALSAVGRNYAEAEASAVKMFTG